MMDLEEHLQVQKSMEEPTIVERTQLVEEREAVQAIILEQKNANKTVERSLVKQRKTEEQSWRQSLDC